MIHTITVRVAEHGVMETNEDGERKQSLPGHLWLVLDEAITADSVIDKKKMIDATGTITYPHPSDGNGNVNVNVNIHDYEYDSHPATSWGFQVRGVVTDDETNYQSSAQAQITSRTLILTQEQFDNLTIYIQNAANNGFGLDQTPSLINPNGDWHMLSSNCIKFVWKGLEAAGFPDKTIFGGDSDFWPSWNRTALNNLPLFLPNMLDEIIKETGSEKAAYQKILQIAQTSINGSPEINGLHANDPLIVNNASESIDLVGYFGRGNDEYISMQDGSTELNPTIITVDNTIQKFDSDYSVLVPVNYSVLSFGNGYNIINAGNGKNMITTKGTGTEIITSGSNSDVINVSNATRAQINSGGGNDIIKVTDTGTIKIDAGDGINQISIDHADTFNIKAGKGDNTITVETGSGSIITGSGNDTIDVHSTGSVYVNGGAGNNKINVHDGINDDIFAGNGDDEIRTSGLNNVIDGGKGRNLIISSNTKSNDSYYFDLNNEQDIIDNFGGTNNAIYIQSGHVNKSSVKALRKGNNLFLYFPHDQTSWIVIEDYFSSVAHHIQSIFFPDGSSCSIASLIPKKDKNGNDGNGDDGSNGDGTTPDDNSANGTNGNNNTDDGQIPEGWTPEQWKAELDRIRDIIAHGEIRIPGDPLVLDLDGNGINTNRSTYFDFNNDGTENKTSWIAGNDAFLVRDLNGNGTIDGGQELFGDQTMKQDGTKATSGFDALADLDSNGDGIFDANDKEFANIKIWQDKNGDGKIEEGELISLTDAGIVSINIAKNGDISTYTDEHGNTKTIENVGLDIDKFYTKPTDALDMPDEYHQLPNIVAMAGLRDLQESAFLDPDLKTAIEQYATINFNPSLSSDKTMQAGALTSLLLEWLKANGRDPSGTPTQVHFNQNGGPYDLTPAQVNKLFILENFLPDWKLAPMYTNHATATNVIHAIDTAYDSLLNSFDQVLSAQATQYMKETQLAPFYDMSSMFIFDADGNYVDFNQSKLETYIANKQQTDLTGLINDFASILGQDPDWFNQINFNVADHFIKTLSYASTVMAPDELTTLLSPFNINFDLNQSRLSMTVGDIVTNYKADGSCDIVAGAGNDIINGGAGNDTITSLAGNNLIHTGDGNNIVTTGTGNDTIYGGTGDDMINAGTGSNHIIEVSGNNVMKVTSVGGHDIFESGTGNDEMIGDIYGYNTYIYGGGQDKILDASYNASYANYGKIVFKEGVTLADLAVHRNGNDMVLMIGGADSGQSITIENAYLGAQYLVPNIEFADGDTVKLLDVPQYISVNDDDVLLGGIYGETFNLGDGNRTVDSGAGNDIINGGAGNDTITSLSGNNLIHTGDGNNIVTTGTGNDTIYGGTGDDMINAGTGSNHIIEVSGNNVMKVTSVGGHDIFESGTGNDEMIGDIYGYNTYIYGGGQDKILDASYNASYANYGKIVFKEGVTLADLAVHRNGNDMVLMIGGADSGQSITIENAYLGAQYLVPNIEFADGSSAKLLDIPRYASAHGDDVLLGGMYNDVFNLGDGNNTVTDLLGNNIIHAGSGNNTITTGTGNDTIYGGTGDDMINAGTGSNHIIEVSGNNVMKVTSVGGHDIFESGTGNDEMIGDIYGYNTYIYGGGQDKILDASYNASYANYGKIVFKEGVTLADLAVHRNGNDMVLMIGGADSGQSITIENAYLGAQYLVPNIEFADGSSAKLLDIPRYASAHGDDVLLGGMYNDVFNLGDGNNTVTDLLGNNIIHAGSGNNTITTGTGNDTIYGGTGDDMINAGTGSNHIIEVSGNNVMKVTSVGGHDIFESGTGNDEMIGDIYGYNTYIYGGGQDKILDASYNASYANYGKIVFKEGVTLADLAVHRNGNDMVLMIGGADSGQSITIENAYLGAQYLVPNIEFADGSSAKLLDIPRYASAHGDDVLLGGMYNDVFNLGDGNNTVTDLLGNNIIHAGSGNNTITTGTGNDTIYGGTGDDMINAGTGSNHIIEVSGNNVMKVTSVGGHDIFESGTGNDEMIGDIYGYNTYIYGGGQDKILDASYNASYANYGKIVFKEGVTLADLAVHRNGNDMVLMIGGADSGQSITIENAYLGAQYLVPNIEFADGSSAKLLDIPRYASAHGDDVLLGGMYNDVFNLGDGNNTVTDLLGNNIIHAGSGNNTITTGTGNDTIYGGTGDDMINAGTGSNHIIEVSGNNVMKVTSVGGHDIFESGTGNDEMIGDIYGYNTYIYGGGQDKILDASYNASYANYGKIVFKEGVTLADLAVHRNGNDMVLMIGGADSGQSITIENAYLGAQYLVPNIEFADGDTVKLLDVPQYISVNDDDVLLGGIYGETFNLGDGNRTVDSGAGNDIINGGAGNDTITSLSGNNLIHTGDGNNIVTTGTGNDTIYGGTGDDMINAGTGSNHIIEVSGNNVMKVTSVGGHDIFESGTGNDEMIGDIYGYNTYIYGGGQDKILDASYNASYANYGKIVFKEGVTLADLAVHRNGNDMVLMIGGADSGQSITIENAYLGAQYLVPNIEFADGSSAKLLDIPRYASAHGDDVLLGGMYNDVFNLGDGNNTVTDLLGNNIIHAGSGNNTITTGTGNDTIYGGTGDDMINAGTGSNHIIEVSGNNVMKVTSVGGHDIFESGTGNDEMIGDIYGYNTYIYGGGQDKILDASYNASYANYGKIVFKEGVTLADLAVHRNGNDMVLMIGGADSGQSITIEKGYLGATYLVPNIEFADGTSVKTTDIPIAPEPTINTEPLAAPLMMTRSTMSLTASVPVVSQAPEKTDTIVQVSTADSIQTPLSATAITAPDLTQTPLLATTAVVPVSLTQADPQSPMIATQSTVLTMASTSSPDPQPISLDAWSLQNPSQGLVSKAFVNESTLHVCAPQDNHYAMDAKDKTATQSVDLSQLINAMASFNVLDGGLAISQQQALEAQKVQLAAPVH